MNLRCQFYRNKCPGTASIENGQLFQNRSHFHDGDSNSFRKLKVETKIKEASEKTPLAPCDIHNHYVEDLNAQMSPYPNLASAMRKRRAKTFPSVPNTLPEFDQLLREKKDLDHLEGKFSSAPLHQLWESLLVCS